MTSPKTGEMPVYGLPVTLEILLESFVEGHILKNWNVFSESQSLVVKLKYDLNNSPDTHTNTGQATPVNMAYKKKAPSQVKRDTMRKMSRQNGQGDRRQTRSQTVHEEKEEHQKEEMRCEVRKTGHIDCDFSFAPVDTHVSHESLQPDMNDQTQNIIDHSTCSMASQVCVPQESTMEPQCHLRQLLLQMRISSPIVMRITARINLIIEHLNVLTMAKDYVMVMLNYCVPNAQDFTYALFVTLVTFTKITNGFL